jgi:hypothetical protein
MDLAEVLPEMEDGNMTDKQRDFITIQDENGRGRELNNKTCYLRGDLLSPINSPVQYLLYF